MAPPRERRPGYSRRAQYGLLAAYVLTVAGAIVGAVLLVLSVANPRAFSALRMTVATVTTPVSTVLAAGVRAVAAVPDTIGSWWDVHGRNAALEAELKQLRPKAYEAQVSAVENARLRALLRVRDGAIVAVATARIVSSSASSTRRYALLNAGGWQGVREGMPVRGPEGLLGRVLEVGPNSARVLLITDPESVVPVKRTRDGLPALAAGRGDGYVDLRAAYTADGRFRPGDVFVTSGSGGLYPPGLAVARVLRSGQDRVPGRPFAHPSVMDFATVLRSFLTEEPGAIGARAMPPPLALPSPVSSSQPGPSPSPAIAAAPSPTPRATASVATPGTAPFALATAPSPTPVPR